MVESVCTGSLSVKHRVLVSKCPPHVTPKSGFGDVCNG